MRKGNGSNGVPAWAKRDLQILKRVSVSLIEMRREDRGRLAASEKMLAELMRRNDRHDERTAINEERLAINEERLSINEERLSINEKILAELIRRNNRLDEQTARLKKSSDIHAKAILKLLDKI